MGMVTVYLAGNPLVQPLEYNVVQDSLQVHTFGVELTSKH